MSGRRKLKRSAAKQKRADKRLLGKTGSKAIASRKPVSARQALRRSKEAVKARQTSPVARAASGATRVATAPIRMVGSLFKRNR